MTACTVLVGYPLLALASYAVFTLFKDGLGAMWDAVRLFWPFLLVLGALMVVLRRSRRSKWFAEHVATFYALDAVTASFALTYWLCRSGAPLYWIALTSSLPFVWDAAIYLRDRSRISNRDS
jgi:hypothetical protein